jgi:putative colanic acid biosynthesis acetyltransferase WcaF
MAGNIENKLNIAANRKMQKYSGKENIKRVIWAIVYPLFRYSPRTFFGWRCLLLRIFGARIGCKVNIYNSATIFMPWNLEIGDWSSIGEYVFVYNPGKVVIGSFSTVSHRAHLCAGTHDYTDPAMPLLKLPITVGGQAWLCTDTFIGPGVNIGEGAVVGARAVVMKDVPPWTIVAGNPAKPIKKRIIRHKEKL